MASASSILMLAVVVELGSDTELPLGESERVDFFPIVAKASLELPRPLWPWRQRLANGLSCILLGQQLRYASDSRRHRPVVLHLDELRSQSQ